jgi:hypothetical protein
MISRQNEIVLRRPLPHKVSNGKQIIYRFNGDPKYDETVSDIRGSLPLCRIGETFTRNGKAWRVTVVRDDLNMAASRTSVPIHRVFLTDKF